MFTSYAQNFEDVMLLRALGHIAIGRYIDIGAQDPVVDSISLAFYERGWRGIHVEPSPHFAQRLRDSRPDETVIQAAVMAKAGIIRFFEIPGTGLSTADPDIAAGHGNQGLEIRETTTPAVTLDEILTQNQGEDVHWMKIDVEGLEKEVLDGWKASPVRPWIVVIESTTPVWLGQGGAAMRKTPLSPSQIHEKWEPKILQKGYRFAYFDGLNRFYVSNGHRELASAFGSGPNVLDDFALSESTPYCLPLNNRLRELQLRAEVKSQETTAALASREQELDTWKSRMLELSARLEASQEKLLALSETLSIQGRELDENKQILAEQEKAIELAARTVAGRDRQISRLSACFEQALQVLEGIGDRLAEAGFSGLRVQTVNSPLTPGQLLDLKDDRHFIFNVYRTFLLRDPDPSGLELFMGHLRQGRSKIEIIRSIRNSSEGRQKGIDPEGIRLEFFLALFYRLPIVGRLVRQVATFFKLPSFRMAGRLAEPRAPGESNRSRLERDEMQSQLFHINQEIRKLQSSLTSERVGDPAVQFVTERAISDYGVDWASYHTSVKETFDYMKQARDRGRMEPA